MKKPTKRPLKLVAREPLKQIAYLTAAPIGKEQLLNGSYLFDSFCGHVQWKYCHAGIHRRYADFNYRGLSIYFYESFIRLSKKERTMKWVHGDTKH